MMLVFVKSKIRAQMRMQNVIRMALVLIKLEENLRLPKIHLYLPVTVNVVLLVLKILVKIHVMILINVITLYSLNVSVYIGKLIKIDAYVNQVSSFRFFI